MCSTFQSQLEELDFSIRYERDVLHVPIFMMIMCARGFILWIMNVGLAIYLGVAAGKLYKEVR